ncbi:MAG: hypothetical protein AMXMBFR84_34150 [Candidatus Hydrogenedentota bacterium]
MSDVKNKLDALLAGKGLMRGAEWKQKIETLQRERESGAFEVDKAVPGALIGEPDNGFYLVRQDFPLDTMQGQIPLGAALDVCPEHIAFAAADDELERFDPARTCFVDTETSGLAGGTGTVTFLIGVGYFADGAFRLEQLFMRDYDDEEPMLAYLGNLFRQFDAVVSYNGKTFDLPLLRTRFIQNRIPFPLDSILHFDLLHAARRFWKERLGRCNLGNVEKHILGLQRHGDVPGELIPQLWFDYLRTRDARPLTPVFYHHKMDILSLAALTAWLSQCLDRPEGEGFEHPQDRLSLIRVQFRQRRYREVLSLGDKFLESEAVPETRRECLEMMAIAGKRTGEWTRMESCWALLLSEHPQDLMARHELAKHFEHRARNLSAAMRLCEESVQFLEMRIALGRGSMLTDSQLAAFQHRLDRLRRKLGRNPGEEELP